MLWIISNKTIATNGNFILGTGVYDMTMTLHAQGFDCIMMFTCHMQSSSIPNESNSILLFTTNFVHFLLLFFTYNAQHKWCTDAPERGVLLAYVLIFLCLMQNISVWLYSLLLQHYRNVAFMELCEHDHL